MEGVRLDHLAQYLGETSAEWEAPKPSPGVERAVRLGGPGTPVVPEFAVVEIAAALGLTQPAASMLCADVLDLAYRLRRIAGSVRCGQLTFERARLIARRTRNLPVEQIALVEEKLCTLRNTGNGPVPMAALVPRSRLKSVTDQAVLTVRGPESAAEAEQRVAESLWVRVSPAEPGAADVTGRLAAADAMRLEQRLDQVAGWLRQVGDTRPKPILRAVALGLLADPGLLRALDVLRRQRAAESEGAAKDLNGVDATGGAGGRIDGARGEGAGACGEGADRERGEGGIAERGDAGTRGRARDACPSGIPDRPDGLGVGSDPVPLQGLATASQPPVDTGGADPPLQPSRSPHHEHDAGTDPPPVVVERPLADAVGVDPPPDECPTGLDPPDNTATAAVTPLWDEPASDDEACVADPVVAPGEPVIVPAGIAGCPPGVLEKFASISSTVLYLHLDRTSDTWSEERGGVLTAQQAKALVGHSKVSVRPVLDLAEPLSYTGYVAPPRLKEQLALLNAGYCPFPYCHRRARAGDVDHQIPAVSGGPTATRNTHRPCRKHHRAKDNGGWRVVCPVVGVWVWTSPAGAVYLVTNGTTTQLNGITRYTNETGQTPHASQAQPSEQHHQAAQEATPNTPLQSRSDVPTTVKEAWTPPWDPWQDPDPLTQARRHLRTPQRLTRCALTRRCRDRVLQRRGAAPAEGARHNAQP